MYSAIKSMYYIIRMDWSAAAARVRLAVSIHCMSPRHTVQQRASSNAWYTTLAALQTGKCDFDCTCEAPQSRFKHMHTQSCMLALLLSRLIIHPWPTGAAMEARTQKRINGNELCAHTHKNLHAHARVKSTPGLCCALTATSICSCAVPKKDEVCIAAPRKNTTAAGPFALCNTFQCCFKQWMCTCALGQVFRIYKTRR